MVQVKYIPYRDIAGALKLQEGDIILLTSDILKLAMKARKTEQEFDTTHFLDSFSDVLGSEGNLLIPAYNFDLEDGDAYDIRRTTPMTGALATAALQDESFRRTAHPLHSFLVRGKDAEVLEGMRNISSFGIDSPFAWMQEHNALMVFAGTTVAEAMTFTHFVEESERVWYRKPKKLKIDYTAVDGVISKKEFWIYAKKPGWTMQMGELEKLLRPEKMQHFVINGIDFYSIRCRDAYEIISKDIKENNARSIAGYSLKLYFRDILKSSLKRFNLFRTTHGKIRSAKRIY